MLWLPQLKQAWVFDSTLHTNNFLMDCPLQESSMFPNKITNPEVWQMIREGDQVIKPDLQPRVMPWDQTGEFQMSFVFHFHAKKVTFLQKFICLHTFVTHDMHTCKLAYGVPVDP